ncbi:MAG: exosortase/archaeosortase family protein [Gammaproteobacteria bacterium]|nr:exosortase/archaeosortase family protein [Gammaproteobacteria bacterium]MDH5629089.1 exosortase/archaeosortase family protein [Gammaproteobacteria bacterium]
MVFEAEQIELDQAGLSWLAYILLTTLCGFWYAWQWYFNRVNASLEEAIGLFFILIFVAVIAIKQVYKTQRIYRFSLWPVVSLLLIYALTFLLVFPDIIRSALAFLTLFLVIYWLAFGKQPPIAFWGLVLISLPVVPSMQFYLGYPARYISASLTVPLLQLNGLSVSQSGTNLIWENQLLQFDAPCSGVTMLWAGLLLTFFISLVYRFNITRTALAVLIACFLILVGNVLRAGSLFYLETGLITVEYSWFHEAIGVVTFIMVALMLMWLLEKIQQRSIK